MPTLPELETERLWLREVTDEHIPAYEQYFVDYEIISHLSAAVPWPFPEGGVRDFLEQLVFPRQGKNRWLWGIFSKRAPGKTNSGGLIGAVDLWREGNPENRGFWLAREHWGKGLMTEAVAPVTAYAFSELGFDKLVFTNAVGNFRSRRVKEKTGARLVSVAPATFVNPDFTEHEIWELTREEWERRCMRTSSVTSASSRQIPRTETASTRRR